MKKLISKLSVVLALMLIVTMAVPAQAATKPGKAGSVKVQEGVYYKYWNAHRAQLQRDGKFQGDGYDAIISWKSASRANGYKIAIYWISEGTRKQTTTVNVKKLSGGKYQFSTAGDKYGEKLISSSTKSYIYKGSVKKFNSTKLSFHVEGNGSDVEISKIVIKSYRTVNGKKIYSSAVTKRP